MKKKFLGSDNLCLRFFLLNITGFILSQAALAQGVDSQLPTLVEIPSQDEFKEVAPVLPSAVQGQLVEGFFYDPTGKRDPFAPPESLFPKERKPPAPENPSGSQDFAQQRQQIITSVPLADLKLTGIMWNPDDPYAMFQLPDSRVMLVRPRNRIGLELAIVASIREGEVLVILPDLEGKYETGEVRSIKLQQ